MHKDTTYKIRLVHPDEYRIVEEITREAFWNLFVPGCDEHYVLHKIRQGKDFMPELDYLVEVKGKIVAQITYTHGYILNEKDEKIRVLSFGPVSVHPKYQGKGIGSELIRYSLEKAKLLGHCAVFIYGDPRYYTKFGFEPAFKYQIKNKSGEFVIPLLALELKEGILNKLEGRFVESLDFEIDKDEFEEYEKTFQIKRKIVEESQWHFRMLSNLKYEEGVYEAYLGK